MRPSTILSVAHFCGLFSLATPASAQTAGETMVNEIIADVVGLVRDKAQRVVNEQAGIDIDQRGFRRGRNHRPLPRDASEETRRELKKRKAEHHREMEKSRDELDRKLSQARAEFEREAAKEDKRGKIIEKRAKLEEKVDDAYALFEEKVDQENGKFDEKREAIIAKAGEEHETAKRRK